MGDDLLTGRELGVKVAKSFKTVHWGLTDVDGKVDMSTAIFNLFF
jgi:hypothetical protein